MRSRQPRTARAANGISKGHPHAGGLRRLPHVRERECVESMLPAIRFRSGTRQLLLQRIAHDLKRSRLVKPALETQRTLMQQHAQSVFPASPCRVGRAEQWRAMTDVD